MTAAEIATHPTIDVLVYGPSGISAQAEAETPEDAVYAGQVLFDEVTRDLNWRAYTVAFMVDGKSVRVIEGRRP